MSESLDIYYEEPPVEPSFLVRCVAFIPYAGRIGVIGAAIFMTGVHQGQEQSRPTPSVSAPIDHYGQVPVTIEGPDGKLHHCKDLTALDCFDVVYGYYPSTQASSGDAMVEPNTPDKFTTNSVNITVSNDNNAVIVSGNIPGHTP